MTEQHPLTILFLASEFKGVPAILEAKRQGCRVLLLTPEEISHEPWPWDNIDVHHNMSDLNTQPDITYGVSYLMRSENIDRIVGLDDYDVATAASLREHLRLRGMGESVARHFRDKLAMRVQAQASGIAVPPFTSVFNHQALNDYLSSVPAPWVLKPRFDAGSIGIRKLHSADEVWAALEELGDQRSFYLLEQFLPGDVFHVDSIFWQGETLFAIASQYGAPPLAVTQGGGIFNTRTLAHDSPKTQTLLSLNNQVLQGLQHPGGVAHTEFIRANSNGRFYFLETAARVGGANIDLMVKAASGIELWAEAARVEIAAARGEVYQLPEHRNDYAGLIICLAQQEHPNLAPYQEPEIVWRLSKPYHAGLLVASPDAERVEVLMDGLNGRFAQDFLAHSSNEQETRTQF